MYKPGDKVKINFKTINKNLDGDNYYYIARGFIKISEGTIIKILDYNEPKLGKRVYFYQGNIPFYIYEKDLISIAEYENRILKKYKI